MKIILASQSPRRIELLKSAVKEFHVLPSSVEEELSAGESPEEYVLRLAREKALDVASKVSDRDCWILGADTVVVLDEQILEKPLTPYRAKRMLSQLQGRAHAVITGFHVCNRLDTRRISRAVKTTVKMKEMTENEIDEYLGTGEPLDKAGGYAIQGIGREFIESIDGSFSNVVGLPLEEVIDAFVQLGIVQRIEESTLE